MRTSGLFAAVTAYFACMGLVFYLSVANSYAETNRVSRKLLQLLRRACRVSRRNVASQTEHRISSQRTRTLRELRIHAGPVFFYDKQLVLTTVQIILVQSANLLVVY